MVLPPFPGPPLGKLRGEELQSNAADQVPGTHRAIKGLQSSEDCRDLVKSRINSHPVLSWLANDLRRISVQFPFLRENMVLK